MSKITLLLLLSVLLIDLYLLRFHINIPFRKPSHKPTWTHPKYVANLIGLEVFLAHYDYKTVFWDGFWVQGLGLNLGHFTQNTYFYSRYATCNFKYSDPISRKCAILRSNRRRTAVSRSSHRKSETFKEIEIH